MYRNRFMKSGLGILLIIGMLLAMLPTLLFPTTANAAGTANVTVIKLASDGVTVLDQKTVTYQEMMASAYGLPVLGDGVTHYYHQGPVFIDDPDEATEQALRWNPAEDTNVLEKDMGALRGTNIKDLCDLVGGMSAGEELKVKSIDGWYKMFAYKNVYQYSTREGPMVLTWEVTWTAGGTPLYPDTGYNDGMRLVWFADDSVNTLGPGGTGIHAFGVWDWHEAADSQYWYYYVNGGEFYPTTTGISGKYVNQLIIYSDDPAPIPTPNAAFTATPTTGTVPLTVNFTDQSTNTPTLWAWDFDNDGSVDSTAQNPSYTYTSTGVYTVKLTVTNTAGSDEQVNTNYITVNAVAPTAAFTATPTTGTVPLTVNFTDQSTNTPTSWAWDFDNDGSVDSTAQNPSYTYTSTGVYTVKLTVTNTAGSDEQVNTNYITVNAVAPTAAFTAAPTTGTAPLSVGFTDQSTNTPTSWAWDFDNNGSVDSSDQNPSYTYTAVGAYSVKLVVTNAGGSDYEIKTDYITVNPPPLITVTSPNGGETWDMGSTQYITWTTNGVSGKVMVELSTNGGTNWGILTSATHNSGSWKWVVDSGPTSQAMIRVSSVADSTVHDSSDAVFTLAEPVRSITVVSPNGGETWTIGTRMMINWNSSNVTGKVNIEVSYDNGTTWVTIRRAATRNDGSYTWRVAGPATTLAMIKVSSADNPAVFDTSDADLTIQ